ncbi:hypothetical protein BGX27_009158 [Mortierella sp. AM989]|nr:hypothetical protein BGX27_009158 [Mortierella sp. AM989]
MAQFLELVKAYSSTLRSLIFHTRLSAFTNPWSALATCPKLDKLDLKGVTVQSQDWTLFSQVSTNVHHLSLTNIDLLQESIGAIDDATIYTCIGNNTSPPRLRKLTLEGLLNTYSGQFPNEIVALIRMCHDLESLRWRTYKLPGGSGNFPSVRHINGCACPKLFNELLKSPWPLTALKSLDISHACLEDEEMASLLDRIRQLKTLKMSSTLFGPLSLQALTEERRALTRDGISGLIISQPRRLCNSIKFLNTDNCRNVTGTMIQTILESCPDLRGLSAGKVTVTEMAQGQSWACSKLEQLTIFLVADDDGDKRNEAYGTTSVRFMRLQQLVFERLNTLTNLQKLVLTNDRVRRRELRRIKTLDLRVDAGLGILTNLKNLRTLYFKSDIPQMMDIEEAVWIAKHWPRLSYMVGPWNQDKAVCHSMNKILKYVRNREPDRHK